MGTQSRVPIFLLGTAGKHVGDRRDDCRHLLVIKSDTSETLGDHRNPVTTDSVRGAIVLVAKVHHQDWILLRGNFFVMVDDVEETPGLNVFSFRSQSGDV